MPVRIFGRWFKNHESAVRYARRARPYIRDPDAYVGATEWRQRGRRARVRPAAPRRRSGLRWKVVCKGRIVRRSHTKRAALTFRRRLTARGRKGCRTLKA